MDFEMLRNIAVPIFRRYDIEKAFVFGSYSRGEQEEDSDIDFLIEYSQKAKRSLLTLVRLKNELQEALQKEVDVVTDNALSPYIKNRVLKDKRVIMCPNSRCSNKEI